MRFCEIEDRSFRHYAGRVDAIVAPVVVLFYVVHVDGLRDAWLLIEVLQVTPQVRVVHDAPQVALEVAVVDGVEAHERREETPVGLRDAVAAQVASRREDFFPVVQGIEELRYGLLVGFLSGGPERYTPLFTGS